MEPFDRTLSDPSLADAVLEAEAVAVDLAEVRLVETLWRRAQHTLHLDNAAIVQEAQGARQGRSHPMYRENEYVAIVRFNHLLHEFGISLGGVTREVHGRQFQSSGSECPTGDHQVVDQRGIHDRVHRLRQ